VGSRGAASRFSRSVGEFELWEGTEVELNSSLKSGGASVE
jgi:hypothetical protein